MNVSLNIDSDVSYPNQSPFHPDQIYPELTGLGYTETDSSNHLYSNVRTVLEDLGLDAGRRGMSDWNPFSDFIREGDRVLIKPNLVLHHNKGREDIDAVVTHASVIRPVVDYVLLALKGTGAVIIGDAPHGDADFEAIVEYNGLRALAQWYQQRGVSTELRDLRQYVYPNGFSKSICQRVDRDPEGYTLVDIGVASQLDGQPHLDRLYGSDYNRKQIVQQHVGRHHKYLIAATVLNSDVVISVPKLKTHKKTGITINLKNLVGINGDKNYLAHYRIGSPSQGGDEYPDTANLLLLILRAWGRFSRDILMAPNKQYLREVYRVLRLPFYGLRLLYKSIWKRAIWEAGDWHGNDTCWRMCLDLNCILRFADATGALHDTPQRRYFCLVDGIVSGEGDGPMNPDPKRCGVIAAGHDPYQTDYICALLMGFDPEKIKLLSESSKDSKVGFSPKDLQVRCRKDGREVRYESINFKFRPHHAWEGAIERNSQARLA